MIGVSALREMGGDECSALPIVTELANRHLYGGLAVHRDAHWLLGCGAARVYLFASAIWSTTTSALAIFRATWTWAYAGDGIRAS